MNKTDKKIEEIIDAIIWEARQEIHDHIKTTTEYDTIREHEMKEKITKALNTEVQKAVEEAVRGFADILKYQNYIERQTRCGDGTGEEPKSHSNNCICAELMTEDLILDNTVNSYLQSLKENK